MAGATERLHRAASANRTRREQALAIAALFSSSTWGHNNLDMDDMDLVLRCQRRMANFGSDVMRHLEHQQIMTA
ncbi:hypothetical protein E4U54_000428 [Claviceps lovelessii]|nr:hypothetical protein E4U54_000428 [Claviceps lovelessii]